MRLPFYWLVIIAICCRSVPETSHSLSQHLRPPMANAVEALDTAILNHLRQYPKAHPVSSPDIRKLAAQTEQCRDGRLPCRVIDARMKALRDAGLQRWDRSRFRYVVHGW